MLRAEVVVNELDRELIRNPPGARRGPRRPRPAAPRRAPTPTCGPCPTCRWRASPTEVERLYRAGRRPPAPSCRAGWPPSPATSGPSSWPASGTIRTSRSACPTWTWRRPTPSTPRTAERIPQRRAVRRLQPAGLPQASSPPGSARPRPAPSPTPSSTRPSATRPIARSRTS